MGEPLDEPLRELADVASAIGRALQPFSADDRLQRVVETAGQVFGAAACSIAILDSAQEFLEFRVAWGEGADELLGTVMPIGVGIAGWVVSSGQAIAVGDVGADPRFAREVAEQTGYIPRTILAAPLDTASGTVGVVEILDRDESGDAQRDLLTLALFAQLAAEVVVSARLFSDMGRLLLSSLADHSTGSLAAALRTAASNPGTSRDLAELADLFAQLNGVAPEDRRLSIDLVNRVLAHAASRHPQ